MQDTLTMDGQTKLSRSKLFILVSELINSKSAFIPNPEDPNPPDPPWPWRHILNRALDRVQFTNPGSLAALNPQPLPPRLHFSMALAQEVVERAAMMQEMADSLIENAEQRGIIIVGGYLNKFVDEICPTPPIITFPKRKWPWPPDPDPDPSGMGLNWQL